MHGNQEPFWIYVLDGDGEKILYGEQFMLKQKSQQLVFSFSVPLYEIMHPIYFIKVISDKWIACETEQPIPFKNLILPEPFMRVTELLQLSRLPINAIGIGHVENVLSRKLCIDELDGI